MGRQTRSSFRWFIGTIIALLAAGSGIVAILNYFNVKPYSVQDNSSTELLPAPVPKPPSGDVVEWPGENMLFIVAWSQVNGASTYTVEFDCFGSDTHPNSWYSQSGAPWFIKHGLGLRSPIFSSKIHLKLRESGGRALRWRVWAVDEHGRTGEKSKWCQFAFSGDWRK